MRYSALQRREEERELRTIPGTVEDLGGKVLRSSAKCVCHVVILHIELAQSEITKGDVARVIEEDVFRLEVAVRMIDSEYFF